LDLDSSSFSYSNVVDGSSISTTPDSLQVRGEGTHGFENPALPGCFRGMDGNDVDIADGGMKVW